eukprot:356742-Chlamydomonas_euryale.AAC.6
MVESQLSRIIAWQHDRMAAWQDCSTASASLLIFVPLPGMQIACIDANAFQCWNIKVQYALQATLRCIAIAVRDACLKHR